MNKVKKVSKLKTDTFAIEVNNLPEYELDKYVVARAFEGTLWFYGTYATIDRCYEVCAELGDSAVIVYNN